MTSSLEDFFVSEDLKLKGLLDSGFKCDVEL